MRTALPVLFVAALSLVACGGSTTPSSESTSSGAPTGNGTASSSGSPQAPTTTVTPGLPTLVATPIAPSNAAVPFHLLVSNQSYDIANVDIDIYIDGLHVVTGTFPVGSQHTWIPFDFPIAAGEHSIRAVTTKGGVEQTQDFAVNATERWAVVDFWYYAKAQGGAEVTPPNFAINLSDSAPMFD